MHRRTCLVLTGAAVLLALWAPEGAGQDDGPPSPLGFAPGSRAAQAKAEARALAVPTPDQARAWLRTLTEEPHVAGTAADHKTALFVRDKLRAWGWKTDLVEYEVLLNYPTSRKRYFPNHVGTDPVVPSPCLELTRPGRQSLMLPLTEAPIRTDKDSSNPSAFPAFHGYGVSGDASGKVVYANYGRPEDFAALERLGIDIQGKIALVRYGEIFRGLKVLNAQRRGAIGILIYSDPADDGYGKGDVYPDGPYRPDSALQRGSVQFLSIGPGDPSTPHGPSVKGAKRLPIDPFNGFTIYPDPVDLQATPAPANDGDEPTKKVQIPSVEQWEKATGLKRQDYFPMIPSLPISYETARPILEALMGPRVPTGWQGGLPLSYHVGPGPAKVRFAIDMDYQVRTIWNVIATIEGSAEPDRWVLLSNHRDAWVYGAVDPGSGTAATLEMCRALGSAVKHGWKPRRTLVYASWDAEEYGLVGSTEWAEEHAKELDEKAVLMLNVDSGVSGPDPDFDGIPSLRDLVLDAAGAVNDARSNKTVRQVWTEQRRKSWASQGPIELFDPVWDPVPEDGGAASAARPGRARFSPQLNYLGSGSDYTAFVDHLGVPAVDLGFHGRYGVYHSIYDDFTWMEKFGDPEFVTHAQAARLFTLFAMRAAGADVLPFRFVPYGEALREHVDDLRRQVERKARAAVPNGEKPPLSFEGLPRLVGAVREFQEQAAALDRATADLSRREGTPPERLAKVNDALTRVERAFLLPDGLPGRPWFKHAVYAPGLTTGYASWPLPALRQAVQDDDPDRLAAALPALVARLDAATEAMRAARHEAEKATRRDAARAQKDDKDD